MPHPLSIEDLFKVERLKHVAMTPDGSLAWVVATRVDLESNTSSSVNYLIDLNTRVCRRILLAKDGASEIVVTRDRIFFVADGQLFEASLDGSNIRQVTKGVGGVSSPVASKDGSKVLFTRTVYINKDAQAEFEKTGKEPDMSVVYGCVYPKARARIADRLFYRHWDAWTENKRNHLFIVDVASGKMVDLTDEDIDTPPIALDSGCNYAFAPDGRSIVFVQNPEADSARSTNNSIYLMTLDGIKRGKVTRISDTDGCDSMPAFISEHEIAYGSMLTPGYEADAVRFKVYDIRTGKTRLYLEHFERSVDQFVSVEGRKILFLSQDFAHSSLYELSLESGDVCQLTCGRTYMSFVCTSDMRRILAVVEALDKPAELVELNGLEHFEPRISLGSEQMSKEVVTEFTHFGAVLDDVEMDPGESVIFDYKDIQLEGYVVRPPGFDASQKYPLILLIHGGPQGAFLDSFHYRWNVEMFAAQGAMVAFCNPHGSTGYGHDLTRAISKHWSDDCPAAVLRFVDVLVSRFPEIDADRMTAAGASFGGFMINWLMGHTDRFKAFVSHDGIFNTEMSGYITDELWFNEYEFGGKPFEVAEACQKHSPHRFVKNFRTPTLVIQGEQDFRCFVSEGVALFTALQYMGVPSRMIYFPDEGHWVLKPANSALWYSEVVGWLMRWANASV
ncbi:MAG: S9 family peptidase [Proteobacteria bacterium]|nr:S9 family peptidase [Pseudomonadota bacterium]